MTNEEMMNKINAIGKAKADAAHADMIAKKAKLRADIEKTLSYLPRLRDARKIVDALYRNGIVKCNRSGAWPKWPFITDGINHGFGFVNTRGIWGFEMNDLVGMEGGGCSGLSFFVDMAAGVLVRNYNGEYPFSVEWAIENLWNDYNFTAKAAAFAARAERMLNELDEFVTKLG